jgi:ABC-type lipoprotein export system ATPase subunit
MTIILVTHEPDIAAHARRVIVVRDGLIERDSPVEDDRGTEGRQAERPAAQVQVASP